MLVRWGGLRTAPKLQNDLTNLFQSKDGQSKGARMALVID